MQGDQLCFDFLAGPCPAEDPVSPLPGPEWTPLTVEEAILWVERNRDSIIAQAARRFALARFDIADLLQEAYLAALEAVNVANRKRLPFEACFRTCFSARVHSTTSSLYAVRVDAETAEHIAARTPDVEEGAERPEDRCWREAEEEALCRQSLEYMTRAQREAWEGLLDRPSCNRSIASRRGVARQTVQSNIRGGLARVREAAFAGAFGG